MQIETALPRLALVISAITILFGLFWWNTDRGSLTDENIAVTVQATPLPPTDSPTEAFAWVERQILETIGEPGTRLHDLRIVDQERLIVCGDRVDGGSATSRRFVWLSQLRQVVTDDGGPDFAILVHVCNPLAPSRIQPISPKGAGDARSRGLD